MKNVTDFDAVGGDLIEDPVPVTLRDVDAKARRLIHPPNTGEGRDQVAGSLNFRLDSIGSRGVPGPQETVV